MRLIKREKWIFIGAVVVRIALLLFLVNLVGKNVIFSFADGPKYLRLAESIAYRHQFVDPLVPDVAEAIRPPGYPLYLSFFTFLHIPYIWASILQIILASFIPILLMRFARKLNLSKKIEVAVGVLAAFEPLQVFYSITLSSDTLGALTFLLSTYYLLRFWEDERLKHIVLSAFFMALFNYVRRIGVYLGFMVGPIIWISGYFVLKNKNRYLKPAAIFIISFFLFLAPWMARNYVSFNSFAFSSSFSRVLFYNTGAAIRAVAHKTSYQEEFVKMQKEVLPELPEPRDIESFKNSSLYQKKAKEIVLTYPKEYFKLYFFAFNTLFASGNYHVILAQLGLLERPSAGIKSFTVFLSGHSLAESWSAVKEFLGEPYGLIAIVGRFFWEVIFFSSLFGLWILWKKYPHSRSIVLVLSLYYAYTALFAATALEGLESRHRLYLNAFMFLLSSVGISYVFSTIYKFKKLKQV